MSAFWLMSMKLQDTLTPMGTDFPPEDPLQETDLPPEFCHYRDEGCELAPACLDCPYEKCVYDEPGGKQHRIKDMRNQEISRLYHAGKVVAELATMFGVSQRTVHRALKRVKDE
jgi:hypothetical protein